MDDDRLTALVVRLQLFLSRGRDRDDRGDVPGWVLITIMSVILMGAILAVAQPELEQMLRASLNSVRQ